jgi:hypothetical protein
MSTFDEHHSVGAATRIRLQTRDRRTRRLFIPRVDAATPVMGPANRAPGVSIMGASIHGSFPGVMGGPDTGPRVSLMGTADAGARLDMFGESDLRFVDSLFTHPRSNHE